MARVRASPPQTYELAFGSDRGDMYVMGADGGSEIRFTDTDGSGS